MLANDCHPTVLNISVDLSLSLLFCQNSSLQLLQFLLALVNLNCLHALSCGRGEGREGGEGREALRKREKGKEGRRVGRGEGRGTEEGQVGNKNISTINGTNYILSMIDAYSVQYA